MVFERYRPSAGILSAADVLIQRGVSSVVVLIMAVFTTPSVVGLVSAATLLVTLYQAAFEAPVRQSGYRALAGSSSDRASLVRVLRVGGLVGGLIVGLSIYFVLLWQNASGWEYIVILYGVIPLIVSWYLVSLLSAQAEGLWATIVYCRLASVFGAALIAVPVLIWFDPVVGVVLQAVLSELLFALPIRALNHSAVARGRGWSLSDGYMRDVRQTSALSLFGWMRGQSDRLWLLVLGGAAVLGSYSVAYALARSAPDAGLVGLTNLYRANLAKCGFDNESIRRQLRSQVVRVMALSWSGLLLAVGAAFAVRFLWRTSAWSGSSYVVPILAFSVFASSMSWTLNATLNHTGESRSVYWIQWFEIALSAVVGVLLARSIFVGSVAVCVREVVGSVLVLRVSSRYVAASSLYVWLANTAAAAAVASTSLSVLLII